MIIYRIIHGYTYFIILLFINFNNINFLSINRNNETSLFTF